MPRTEAQLRAVHKYDAKAYDRVVFRVKKGNKADIDAFAKSKGKSLSGFINEAIHEKIAREGG
jgi:uncharacterized protein (DUF1778 family)